MKRDPKVGTDGKRGNGDEDRRRLVLELEVRQLELELQNRSLRENQELLEESRARYAELYDYAPIGHLTLDDRGVIHELNLATAALLGLDRARLLKLPLRASLAPRSNRALDAHLRACARTRQAVAVELELSSGRVVELVSVPRTPAIVIPTSSMAERFFIHSAMHDISERKREEEWREELRARERAARAQAESAGRAKEAFLDIVSHELRAPLAPMSLWLRALRAGGAGEVLRGRAIEAIETCLKIQSAMIDDLVDMARGRRGNLRVERQPMDLQRAVSAAVEALAPSCAAKRVALDLAVEATPTWVMGDATRLQQVVGNLLSNAIKFTGEGGRISVSLETRDAEAVLSVRDDGEGIEATMMESIFEPFTRAETVPPRRCDGLGLGLAIVRQLVTQHEGRVVAESRGKGQGSCFTVTLPGIQTRGDYATE